MDSSHVKIQGDQIQYKGVNFPLKGVKVELFRRDPMEGFAYLLILAVAYVFAYFVIYIFLNGNILFSWAFIGYILSFVPVLITAYGITSKFLLESATIHLDGDTEFTIPSSGISREMIRAIAGRAEIIEYIPQSEFKEKHS